MIEIEFTEIDVEVKDFTPTRHNEYWINCSAWAREGRQSAGALLQYGHKGLRVVVDSEWELAITCDDCGLWGSMTRRLPSIRMSHPSVSGAIFEVVDCSPTAVRDRFRGAVTKSDAWDGYSGWQIGEPIINSRDGELMYFNHVRNHKNRHARKKEMEAPDEATTEE